MNLIKENQRENILGSVDSTREWQHYGATRMVTPE
jgi:hypothetical protein